MIKNLYEKEQENNMMVDALKHTSEIITVLTHKVESLENNFEILYNELLKLKPDSKINIINKTNNQKIETFEKILNKEENTNIFILNQDKKKNQENQENKKEFNADNKKEFNADNKKEFNTDKKNKIIRDILNYKKNQVEKNDSNDSNDSDIKEKNISKVPLVNINIDMFSEKKIQNSVRRKKNTLFSKY
jgi:hypothetical protein